jgi:hypothetical protein
VTTLALSVTQRNRTVILRGGRALNDFLAAAPRIESVCGQVAALVSVNDSLRVRLHDGNDDLDAALGDLVTQGGKDYPALTSADTLGPSEAFRAPMDYYAHASNSCELPS